MKAKMIRATGLPDMSGWTDTRIEKWLATHDTTEILKRAIKEKAGSARPAKQTKQHISLRIELAYIEQAKTIASRKGIGYQTLMRSLVVEGLSREASTSRSRRPSAHAPSGRA